MKLSEELEFRGFKAETTIENPESLDSRENKHDTDNGIYSLLRDHHWNAHQNNGIRERN